MVLGGISREVPLPDDALDEDSGEELGVDSEESEDDAS